MRNASAFVLGDHTKRSAWANSFYMPTNPNASYVSAAQPFFTYGAVQSGAVTIDQIGLENLGCTTPGFQQVCVANQGGAVTAVAQQVSSLTPTFPAGSLPLAVLVLDG